MTRGPEEATRFDCGKASILIAGLVPSGPSGVRDYGHLLAEELTRQGRQADEMWLDNDGLQPFQALAAAFRLLRWAWSVPSETVVVWNYSPFAYAFRGIPLPGVLLGMVLRTRRVPVVTVLHELAYPWGRHGIAGRVFAATQGIALPVVVAGSASLVVTTEQRATLLSRVALMSGCAAVHVIPVFSTIRQCESREPADDGCVRLGVIGYGSDGASPDVFIGALAQLSTVPRLRIVLIGAPGADSREGRKWLGLARRAGLGDRLEFTGVVSEAELSSELRRCDAITLVDEEGPTSRRTMLAAALAHGCPVVATDGPKRWEDATSGGAFLVVPPHPDDLARALRRVLEDPQEREAMSIRAATYYDREMSVERAALAFSAVVAAVQARVTSAQRRGGRNC